jgi:hypothetical protein
MGVCVCVNVLCGIVRKESFSEKPLVFSPRREKDIFFGNQGEGNLSRV